MLKANAGCYFLTTHFIWVKYYLHSATVAYHNRPQVPVPTSLQYQNCGGYTHLIMRIILEPPKKINIPCGTMKEGLNSIILVFDMFVPCYFTACYFRRVSAMITHLWPHLWLHDWPHDWGTTSTWVFHFHLKCLTGLIQKLRERQLTMCKWAVLIWFK